MRLDRYLSQVTTLSRSQARNMIRAGRGRVESLHRESIGRLKLDEALGAGDYRPLSPEEVALF
ncbi:MAG: hypothetical protein KZQ78_04255 [Candidatus Thiodiazotropha sp. (ex Ustalcina ferruginea)]|nr:hypothetical protein [Candidatus Thiodiazotropha sp. (ex Ustalcina ferruginea)]